MNNIRCFNIQEKGNIPPDEIKDLVKIAPVNIGSNPYAIIVFP
jgi:hypothetical protein